MANIHQTVMELIGHTPLLAAKSFARAYDLPTNLLVKLEYFNPAGSVKDRVAAAMIEQAEREGKIAPGATLSTTPRLPPTALDRSKSSPTAAARPPLRLADCLPAASSARSGDRSSSAA